MSPTLYQSSIERYLGIALTSQDSEGIEQYALAMLTVLIYFMGIFYFITYFLKILLCKYGDFGQSVAKKATYCHRVITL